MTDIARYNNESMPMKDIMEEIRARVTSEANARHAREQTRVKQELLILRPEARVDRLLQEPEREPVPKPKVAPAPDEFTEKLTQAIGVSDSAGLEALIRKVLREELTTWGDR